MRGDVPVDYIVKLIRAGFSNEAIVHRIGRCSHEDVASVRASLTEQVENRDACTNGYEELSTQVGVMANQLELFGQSLWAIVGQLGNLATPTEVRLALGSDGDVNELMRQFIVLRRYSLQSTAPPTLGRS